MQNNFDLFRERFALLMKQHEISNYRLHKDIGCSRSSVANWLDGKALPDFERMVNLADYFDVSIDYLAGRTDNPEINE